MKKYSRGLRKYIRKRKAQIRKDFISLAEQEKAIKDFLAGLRTEE